MHADSPVEPNINAGGCVVDVSITEVNEFDCETTSLLLSQRERCALDAAIALDPDPIRGRDQDVGDVDVNQGVDALEHPLVLSGRNRSQ
jgi:hypothetical protein